MNQPQTLRVRIADLCALVENKQQLTILFPECRMPQKAVAADPNPEHRLGIRVPVGEPYTFPSGWKEDVREVRSLQHRHPDLKPGHHYIWFPVDRDLRIVSADGNQSERPDMSQLKPFLTSFQEIYPEPHKQKHARVDPAYLTSPTTSVMVREHLDGRLFIGSGRLEPSQDKNLLDYWDNSYEEGNRVQSKHTKLTDEIFWVPELSSPVLQAKAFDDDEGGWQTVLRLGTQLEIFNAPVAAYLELESWYKSVGDPKSLSEAPGSSELRRSKHFQILAHLCEAIPKPRDIRLPYFLECAGSSITHPVACPPGYFTDDP